MVLKQRRSKTYYSNAVLSMVKRLHHGKVYVIRSFEKIHNGNFKFQILQETQTVQFQNQYLCDFFIQNLVLVIGFGNKHASVSVRTTERILAYPFVRFLLASRRCIYFFILLSVAPPAQGHLIRRSLTDLSTTFPPNLHFMASFFFTCSAQAIFSASSHLQSIVQPFQVI